MSFGDIKTIKAGKKEHRCVWCWYQILVGSSKVHFFGEWDGELQNWHMHPECYDAFQREDEGCDGRIHDHRHKRGMTCDEEKTMNNASSDKGVAK
jgi:hypothetical protein